MSERINEFGQPIGAPLPGWHGAARPSRSLLAGRFCRIEPLGVHHAGDLFAAFDMTGSAGSWTYMPYGPFAHEDDLRAWIASVEAGEDPLFFALVEQATNRPVGFVSYLRISPEYGVIEVGNVAFSPLLQKTAAATEAMYLMMRHAFEDLGYRRYEWKCDALNAPSRRAAARLGFVFDGVFRQALVYKGRNRDTAWFSVLDRDWPQLRAGFARWLEPANFDADGGQRQSLEMARG